MSPQLLAIFVWGVIAGVVLIVLWRCRVLSIRETQLLRRRDPHAATAVFWMGSGLALYAIMVAGSMFGALAIESLDWDAQSLDAQALMAWAAYITAIMAFAGMFLSRPKAYEGAGFKIRGRDPFVGVGAYLLAAPIVMVVLLAAGLLADTLRGAPSDPISHELLAELTSSERTLAWWGLVAAVVIAAPIVEELIYRGFLQTAIRAAGGSPVLAIVVTAAVFAAAHVSSVRPEAIAGLFVLGIAFGLAFERTGRLGTAVVMHIAFNAANLAQAIIFK